MPDYSTISRELAEFLHQQRERVLPFIGACVSVNAGVPAAADLARLIAARASAEGVEVAADASFAEVCAAVSEQLDHLRLQQITAAIIDELELQPTPLQQLIVQAPWGVVATTNFDRSLSLAAESAGLTPLVRTPQEAHALDTPQEGEVVIVHLHGHVDEPAGMALPGASMDALANDETFKTVLRGLVIARAVVYLGYRLPPEDTYLHREIETLATMFADRGPHRLLIPSNEREARRAEARSTRAVRRQRRHVRIGSGLPGCRPGRPTHRSRGNSRRARVARSCSRHRGVLPAPNAPPRRSRARPHPAR